MDKGVNVIINNKGKILILRRSSAEYYAGLWDFPGGTVEKGETLQQAGIREVKEESGLEIKLEKDYFYVYHYQDKELDIYGFKADFVNGNVVLSEEHTEFKWISKDEYKTLEYTPSVGATIKEFFK